MRLAAQNFNPQVSARPDSTQPIRLRTGAMTYSMTTAEAIDLASKLADAVDEVNHPQQGEPHV